MKSIRPIKRIGVFLLVVFLLAAVTGCGARQGGGGAEYNLIAAHVSTEEHSFHYGLLAFKEKVEELSGGRITVEVHPNGELGGNEEELVQKMATGTVDVIIAAPSFMSQCVKQADFFAVPYLFESLEHWEKVVDGEPGQQISQLIEERSGLFKCLGYFKDGIRSMYTVKPVTSVEDMKDLKFRIQNSPTQNAFWSMLGVQPASVAFNEIYQALQNNVIDGAENALSQIYQQKHYEVCKNITLTEHDVATRFFLIAQEKYNDLPDDLKAVVDEAGAYAVEEQRRVDLELESKYRGLLEEAGCNLIPIDKAPLIEMTEQVRIDVAEKLGLTDMLTTINSLKINY